MTRFPGAARAAWLAGGLAFLLFAPAAFAQAPVDLTRRTVSTNAADHRALAAHYRAHATEHEADAAAHEALVADARARATDDDAWDLARDAAHYAEHSREAAEALRDLAQLHDAIAERLAPNVPAATDATAPANTEGCCAKHKAQKAAAGAAAPTHDHPAK